MKNQYFGDEKDYLTYGLLRTLAQVSGLRVGVAWMLTPDAANGEGELRAYLKQPEKWGGHDPELFAQLGRVPDHGRSVAFAPRFQLVPGACYFDETLPERQSDRQGYFQRLFETMQDCELVFFDPDKGLETRTTPHGARRSAQHLYWEEVVQAYHTHEHSLLIFQHFPRRAREDYLEERAQQFSRHLGLRRVEWFQTSQVVFFLLAHPRHAAALEKVPAAIQAGWGARIWPGARVFLPVQSHPAGLHLTILPGRLAVCRLAPDAAIPPWAAPGELTAIVRTPQELSIVCADEQAPHDMRAERGWRALKVAGPLDFSLIGVLSSLVGPLATAGISIFALSTYDTDYLLVKEDALPETVRTLHSQGHHIQND